MPLPGRVLGVFQFLGCRPSDLTWSRVPFTVIDGVARAMPGLLSSATDRLPGDTHGDVCEADSTAHVSLPGPVTPGVRGMSGSPEGLFPYEN